MWIISQRLKEKLSESLHCLPEEGGILGGKLLGWETVGAVELEPYAAAVLCARQNDGILPPFPIWDDVCSFDGNPWRGRVDIISGGFPCQDISCAGKQAGIDGKRSGLWREFARIINEIRPPLVFVENSNHLVKRGLARVLGDLAKTGYDAEWMVMGADDVGAPHIRKRIWILAADSQRRDFLSHAQLHGTGRRKQLEKGTKTPESGFSYASGERCKSDKAQTGVAGESMEQTPERESCRTDCEIPDSNGERLRSEAPNGELERKLRSSERRVANEWWRAEPANASGKTEPDMGRVAHGVAARMDRLKAIGNGQVPLVAATAFCELLRRITQNAF